MDKVNLGIIIWCKGCMIVLTIYVQFIYHLLYCIKTNTNTTTITFAYDVILIVNIVIITNIINITTIAKINNLTMINTIVNISWTNIFISSNHRIYNIL